VTDEEKNKLAARLHRISGQLRGVEQMVFAERPLPEVAQQLWAVRAAVTSLTLTLIENTDREETLIVLRRLLKTL